jgi:hypothetical protein
LPFWWGNFKASFLLPTMCPIFITWNETCKLNNWTSGHIRLGVRHSWIGKDNVLKFLSTPLFSLNTIRSPPGERALACNDTIWTVETGKYVSATQILGANLNSWENQDHKNNILLYTSELWSSVLCEIE